MRRLFFFSLFFLVGVFFAQNVLAVSCLGVGEQCVNPTDPCPSGSSPIGTCGLNDEKTCCKGSGPPAGARDCVADGGTCSSSGTCMSNQSPSPSRACPTAGAMCCMLVGPVGGGPGGGPGGPSGGVPTGPSCPGYWKAGICFPATTGLSNVPVYVILYNFVWWLLAILGFIGIIAFVISGMQYLLSAGNEKMIETAKRNMMYSMIGMVVALSGLVIIFFIHEVLSGGLVLFFNIGF